MKVFRISLFALLLITLVGCGAQSLNNLNLKKAFGLDKDLDAAPFTVVTPERLSLREKDLPDDAKLVIATLIHQLYMEPGLPSEVSFDKRGRHQLYDPNFDYAGFQFSGIDLIDYSFNKQVSPIEFRIEGLFHFSDLIGRRTSVEYVASYVPVKKGVKILESSIRPIQPFFP